MTERMFNQKTTYQHKESCNKCSGTNTIKEVDSENGVVYEAETTCKDCGFRDYWATGFFQSGMDGYDKAKTY